MRERYKCIAFLNALTYSYVERVRRVFPQVYRHQLLSLDPHLSPFSHRGRSCVCARALVSSVKCCLINSLSDLVTEKFIPEHDLPIHPAAHNRELSARTRQHFHPFAVFACSGCFWFRVRGPHFSTLSNSRERVAKKKSNVRTSSWFVRWRFEATTLIHLGSALYL